MSEAVDSLTQLHIQAMELSEQADEQKKAGLLDQAQILLKEAYRLEARVAKGVDQWPAKGILLKSAAYLAFECGEFDESYTLCGQVLSSKDTPCYIRNEILELLQDVQFLERHLDLSALRSCGSEVEFSLVGPAVAHGKAPAHAIFDRANNLHALVVRASEFNSGLEYRAQGRTPSGTPVKDMYMDSGRAASFSVKLMFGNLKQQGSLFSDPAQSISDVMLNFERLEAHDLKGIRDFFLNSQNLEFEDAQAYYRNFISLAAPFLPDGNSIHSVGLGWVSHQRPRGLLLKRRSSDYKGATKRKPTSEEPQQVQIIGTLFQANSRQGKVTLECRPIGSSRPEIHELHVQKGLQDIVKRYFEHTVQVDIEVDTQGAKWLVEVEPYEMSEEQN